MITILVFCIPILFLFLYTVFFSFEIAAALNMTRRDARTSKFSVTPIWEVTNVFLVFVVVSLIAFFPGGLATWGPLLAVPALVFLTVQAIRVGSIMIISYGNSSSHGLRMVLAITSIATPAILLGGTLPVFLIGQNAFSSGGWMLGLALALATALVSVTTARAFLAKRRAITLWAGFLFWTWIVLLTVIWIAGSVWFFPGATVLAPLLADKSTMVLLLCVCVVGILVALPGIVLLYSIFL